jgi:hypothetical protein
LAQGDGALSVAAKGGMNQHQNAVLVKDSASVSEASKPRPQSWLRKAQCWVRPG